MDEFCNSTFWNASLTVNTPDPELTPCMEQTVLFWIPCGFLILFAPAYIVILVRRHCQAIPHAWLNVLKTLLGCLLVGLPLVNLVVALTSGSPSTADIVSPVLLALTNVLAIVLIQLGRRRSDRSSGFLFLYWLLHTGAGVLSLKGLISRTLRQGQVDDLYYFSSTIAFYVLCLAQLILSNFVDKSPEYQAVTGEEKPCPELSSNFLSRITFWWFTGMVIRGYKKALERKNLWTLNRADYSAAVVPKFEEEWRKEVAKSKRSHEKHNPPRDGAGHIDLDSHPLNQAEDGVEIRSGKCPYQPSLVKCLIRAFGTSFLAATFFKFCQDALTFVNPQLLKAIIAFTTNYALNSPTDGKNGTTPAEGDTVYVWQGYLFAVLMFVTSLIQSMILHQYFHYCFSVGMRVRTAVISAVYRKSLKLSNAARRSATVGEITNLMAVDAQRFMDITTTLNLVWSAPFQMCVALYFLWQELGPSVLAGLAVMILLLPVNACIAKKTRTLQVQQMRQKDSRIKMMFEILNGFKVLKLYAWELSFKEKILGIRNAELTTLKRSAYLNATTTFTWTCAPFLVSLTTFAVYVLSDSSHNLDASKAFVSLSLFNILRFPMSMLPQLIASLVQVSVSVTRLQEYLCKEELDPKSISRSLNVGPAISVDKGTFSWDKNDPPTLQDISIDIKQGSLVAVVGTVGSGKSSLLAAMLGEMERIKGTVNLKGEVAYVAQQAWIQNATMKDNILFGKPQDNALYYKVMESCALLTDLEMLPAADLTEIGEKGINLSGGQKQRVNLARAVYADTDIYLLDDPLSAVDSHVGKHIFDSVVGPKGVLKNKTRILVTHGISFLPQVDTIIVLVDGKVTEAGSYRQLLNAGKAFADFLKNYLAEEEEEDLEELDDETKSIREEIISCIGDVCFTRGGQSVDKEVAMRKSGMFGKSRSPSSSDHPAGGRPSPRGMPGRQMSRQLSRQMSRQRSVMGDGAGSDGGLDGGGPGPRRGPAQRLTRQITIADDECHPPAALMGKVQETDRLIQTETAETGRVKGSVFINYMRAIGIFSASMILLFYTLSNGCSVGSNFWLSDWSSENSKRAGNDTTPPTDQNLRLGVYGILGLAQGVSIMCASFAFASGRVEAARRLHLGMLSNILRSPLHFFDTTPMGRITNRFSKDIDMIDMVIPATLSAFLQTFLSSFSSLIVIIISTPIFLAVLLPLAIIYYLIQRFYVASSRQLKRLESVSRSPIYSHFGETIQGAVTIRAYKLQDKFILDSERKVDDNQMCYYPNIVSNRWLAVRLEFVGNCIVLFAALFAVIGATTGTVDIGTVGLSISYAMTITSTLNMMVRMTSELETNIVAVERVKEYSETPTEADWINEDNRPSPEWPDSGHVTMEDYCTRYRPGLDLVLKGISCDVKGGETVGIVGRTGAGKSSLTLALFRIIEPAGGRITIDGINIMDIGLHDLRSKLTIIPQDPVLFSGSLRMNLDPFDKYTDSEVWGALQNAHLKDFIASLPEGLAFMCSEGGENLSVGQRQLVCLARALLRKTKVLILDEATAAVDLETDDLIQATIRTEFADCTVLTIAHRLNTIMDYDRIMVLDAGRVAEFDGPNTLLANSKSIFYGMAKDAGLAE